MLVSLLVKLTLNTSFKNLLHIGIMILKTFIAFISFISFIGYVALGPTVATLDEDLMCGEKDREDCLDQVKALPNITNPPFTSDQKELDLLCEKFLSGYNCSQSLFNDYTVCLTPEDKVSIPILINNAENTYRKLCGAGRNNFGHFTEGDGHTTTGRNTVWIHIESTSGSANILQLNIVLGNLLVIVLVFLIPKKGVL